MAQKDIIAPSIFPKKCVLMNKVNCISKSELSHDMEILLLQSSITLNYFSLWYTYVQRKYTYFDGISWSYYEHPRVISCNSVHVSSLK